MPPLRSEIYTGDRKQLFVYESVLSLKWKAKWTVSAMTTILSLFVSIVYCLSIDPKLLKNLCYIIVVHVTIVDQ